MVDESGSPPEVGKVSDGDVARVRTLRVEVWEIRSRAGVEVSVAEVAVCEGIGAILEPDDDGVNLTDSAQERVVNVAVDCVSGNQKTNGCIDAVSPRNGVPGCLERAGSLNWIFVELCL